MKSSDSSGNKAATSLYDRANWLSKLYCWYIFPFLYQHYQKDFDLSAIDCCSKDDHCELLGDKLRRHWTVEVARRTSGKTASLLRAIFKCFCWFFLAQNIKNFIVYGTFRMALPLVLGRIIHYSNLYFEELEEGKVSTGWFGLDAHLNVILSSCLLGLIIFANFCVSHPYYMCNFRYGMHIRVAVTRLVYEKALKVTNGAVRRITVGRITNLISNDANRFDHAYTIGWLYLSPLQTVIAITLLYGYIGRSSFGALAIIVVYIPFQTVMANILSRFRSASAALTDDRLRLMAEILPANSIRVIKMYCWEKPFANLVHIARRLEVTKIRHSMILRSINLAVYFVAPKVMSFICIILYLLDNGKLNAERVFVTLSLVAHVRDVITFHFPMAVANAVEIYISIKRIENFLLEEEIDRQIPPPIDAAPTTEPRITLDRVSVNSKLDGSPILRDISFSVVPRQLTVIIGQVGAGKTSVLMSILKELPISGPGSVQVTGKLAYCEQEAWIVNASIQDNILLGREFDLEQYKKVVKMTALKKDFKQFPDGDQMMVEDRGQNLSGGQRARIALARALYTDADCYLLDAPLSAVDVTVAKYIFEQCIKKHLANKCVILVTHQLQFVKQADQIVVLKDGSCLASGNYIELLNRHIDLYKYSAITELQDKEPTTPEVYRSESFNSDNIFQSCSRSTSFIDCETDANSLSDQLSILDYTHSPLTRLDSIGSLPDGQADNHSIQGAPNVESSSAVISQSKLKIYWTYIRAGASIGLFVFFLAVNLITQLLFTGSDFWLSAWTDFKEKSSIPGYNFSHPIIAEEEHTNILIYSGLVVALFLFSIMRTVSYFVVCMRASVRLHNQMFSSLITAPIAFFDCTPIGIIMNRVSRDLGLVDDVLPPTAFEAIEILGNSLAVFILIAILNYFIIFPFLVLVVLIYFSNRFYVNTARKLKRLEAVARSPLFNQMASTLNGLPTIRSYRMEQIALERFERRQDTHSASYFAFISASRLYGIWLEVMTVIYVYCLLLVLNLKLHDYTGALIGLTISQSLQLTNTFNWGVRQYTEVETYMTSVERIAEFGQLDKEELEKSQVEPADNWPSAGEIEYRDVSLSYGDTRPLDDIDEAPPAVLRNLNFTIKAAEKVGVVGRTGAGKSSLITTLFRLTQPSGSIRIDGINTADISLTRLRGALSIIPQEPILFSGNIRRNLDPFSEKTDHELWDAIDKVQLRSKINSLPAKLDSPVSECGSDLSVGQKQLICLARALLRKNRILVLDEASANVDTRTDALIQNTIRTEFAHCTVITIAHRLNTIIDYDRVLVLNSGEIVQFDTPCALIEAPDGVFKELFNSLNSDARAELRRQALKAHEGSSTATATGQQERFIT